MWPLSQLSWSGYHFRLAVHVCIMYRTFACRRSQKACRIFRSNQFTRSFRQRSCELRASTQLASNFTRFRVSQRKTCEVRVFAKRNISTWLRACSPEVTSVFWAGKTSGIASRCCVNSLAGASGRSSSWTFSLLTFKALSSQRVETALFF